MSLVAHHGSAKHEPSLHSGGAYAALAATVTLWLVPVSLPTTAGEYGETGEERAEVGGKSKQQKG